MAENKKSFIMYCDYQQVFNTLTDKEAGQLIKHILSYVNDENPVLENRVLKIAFEPIKSQMKRDLAEWEQERAHRSTSGKLGGIKSGEARRSKRSTASQNEAPLPFASKNEANEAVNVTVTDTVNVNVGVIGQPPTQDQVEYFFTKCGKPKEAGTKFYFRYKSTDWKDGAGNEIRDWTAKAQEWIVSDHEYQKKNGQQKEKATW